MGESWAAEPDPCLSVAVRYFFPDDTAYELIDIQQRERRLSGNNSDHESVKWYSTGSLPEKLNIPGMTDIPANYISKADTDIMMCFSFISRFLSAEGHKTHLSLKPGYCYIKLKIDEIFSDRRARSNMPYVLTDLFDGHLFFWNDSLYMKNSFIDVMLMPSKEAYRVISEHDSFFNVYRQDEGSVRNEATPAMSYAVSTDGGRNDHSYDYVPCFQVPWPVEANEWRERSRNNGFPTPHLIKSIVSAGCHIVCKQNKKSKYSHIEWRYSFSVAELALAKTLIPKQRICYRVFKGLVKHQGEKRALKIQTYLLKSTLFWFCEESPRAAWTLNNLGRLLLCLLNRFLDFLHAHDLPQYFIRENNLIENQPDKDIDEWVECVKYIKEDPIRCMEEFMSKHVPYDRALWSNNPHIYCEEYVRILQNRCSILRHRQSNIQDTVRIIKTSLKNTGFYFATQSHHEMMLSVIQTVCASIQCSGKLQVILKERNSNDRTYEELQLLKDQYMCYVEWNDNPFSGRKESMESILAVLRAELACICYQMSTMHSSKGDCDRLRKEAMNHVNIAFSYTHCPWTVHLKCHMLLAVNERYDNTFYKVLQPFSLELSCDNFVVYSRYTNQCVDQTLRMFNVIHSLETHYYAHAMAYYIFHVFCKELEIDPEIYDLPKIKDLCDNLIKESLWERDYIYKNMILFEGCFFLRYGHVHKALFCFMQSGTLFESGVYCWYCIALIFCFYHAQL